MVLLLWIGGPSRDVTGHQAGLPRSTAATGWAFPSARPGPCEVTGISTQQGVMS